jgi:DNA-binding winged helix-turn-helix (wHTH) protein
LNFRDRDVTVRPTIDRVSTIAGMSITPSVEYRFGGFSLLPADKQLLHDGKAVPLVPKAFDTLLVLVESGGHLVEKDAFLKRVWPDSLVEEVALPHSISEIRKALRKGAKHSDFIETVPSGHSTYRRTHRRSCTAGSANESRLSSGSSARTTRMTSTSYCLSSIPSGMRFEEPPAFAPSSSAAALPTVP